MPVSLRFRDGTEAISGELYARFNGQPEAIRPAVYGWLRACLRKLISAL